MKDTMAIIFAYQRTEQMKALTEMRSLPSVPFGGRYRIIDFALSNIVNSGITKVGIITRNSYQSLMDHLGSGKPWDLNRKNDGLFVLPPFFMGADDGGELYRGKMDALMNAESFIRRSNHKYVLLATANAVFNMTYDAALAYHEEKEADITIIYKKGSFPRDGGVFDGETFLHTDETGRVTDVSIDPLVGREKLSTGQIIIGKSLLETLMWECKSRSAFNLTTDVLQRRVKDLRIYGYEYDGLYLPVSTVNSYYDANMALLDADVRGELLLGDDKIYTKVHDDVPSLYLEGSDVTNSLISDGCIIQGKVENSILSRNVRVRPGAVVKNCIILHSCEVQAGAHLECVIADKNTVIRENTQVISNRIYPMVIPKGTVVG